MGRLVAVLVLLVLASGPACAAGADRLNLSYPAPGSFDAQLAVLLGGGSLFTVGDDPRGTTTLHVTNATLEVGSYRRMYSAENAVQIGGTETEELPLANASLTLTVSGYRYAMRAAAPEGSLLRVAEQIDGPAAPSFLATHFERDLGDGSGSAESSRIEISWPAGWAYLGAGDHPGLPGIASPWPRMPDALLLDGQAVVELHGGKLAVTSGPESGRSWTLGVTTEQEIAPSGAARIERVRHAYLRGEFRESALPLAATWAAAAPTARWSVDGTASWDNATGSITRDGATRRFVDERVEVDMRGELRPTAPELSLPGATHAVEGEGEFSRVVISGETLAAPSPAAAPVATVSLLALVLAFLTKPGQGLLAYVFALYSRLTPDKVLDHPTRRRIVDLVRAQPGLHLRELHREVGGAWGPFSFHVRTLERAGFLRTATQGRYSLVYPADAAPPVDAIPHPVARAIYDALPADGAPLGAAELAARVGVSRELLRYHLKALEARGLVGRADVEGRIAVSRVAPVAEAPAAA